MNLGDNSGKTPLHRAASSSSNRIEITRLLLDHGADVNAQDILGDTPLMAAVRMWNVEMAQILLEAGADVNMKWKISDPKNSENREQGWTALHWAAHSGRTELIQLLLDYGADLEAVDAERLARKELENIGQDPIRLKEFIEKTSDPALADYKTEARGRLELIHIAEIRSIGIGDRFVIAGIQPAEGAPKASTTLSYHDGYVALQGEFLRDSVPISGILPSSFSDWGDGSVVRIKGEIELEGITFEGDQEYPISFLILRDVGLVYIDGNGSVKLPDGEKIVLPQIRI